MGIRVREDVMAKLDRSTWAVAQWLAEVEAKRSGQVLNSGVVWRDGERWLFKQGRKDRRMMDVSPEDETNWLKWLEAQATAYGMVKPRPAIVNSDNLEI